MFEEKISELSRLSVQLMAERGAAALRVENLDRDIARVNAQRDALQYAAGLVDSKPCAGSTAE